MKLESVDAPIGCPFNIAGYALLTYMIAQQCDLKPGHLIYSMGSAHIYENQVEGVMEQLSRRPTFSPKLKILRKPESIDDYVASDFELTGYSPHPHIKFPIAV